MCVSHLYGGENQVRFLIYRLWLARLKSQFPCAVLRSRIRYARKHMGLVIMKNKKKTSNLNINPTKSPIFPLYTVTVLWTLPTVLWTRGHWALEGPGGQGARVPGVGDGMGLTRIRRRCFRDHRARYDRFGSGWQRFEVEVIDLPHI